MAAVFGCNAQKKPVPQEKIIPQESTIGFEQVDIEQTPDLVKRMLSSMSNREMVAWANAADNNYIIINPEHDETIKVDKVIQRVPSRDFLWLDIKLVEVDHKKKETTSTPVIIKLDKTDKSVNGVGFEIQDEDDLREKQPAETAKTAPGPAAPVSPAPEKKPAAPLEPAPKVETPQQQNQLQQEQEQKLKQQQQLEQEKQTEKEGQ